MKKWLLNLATILWILSFIVFLISYIGFNIQESIPLVWVLFPGVFVVFAPAIYFAKVNHKIQEYAYDNNMFGNNVPLVPFFEKPKSWIISILIVSAITAIISISTISKLENGAVEIKNEKFIFKESRSDNFREISKQEYDKFESTQLGSFIGFSLIFYSISILVYSKLLEWELEDLE